MTVRKLFTLISLFVCIILFGNGMQNEVSTIRNKEMAEACHHTREEYGGNHEEMLCFASPGMKEKPLKSDALAADSAHVAKMDSLHAQLNKIELQTRTGSWFKYLIRWIRLVIALS